MAKPNPTIVVPGITATYLRDYYPVSPETIWAVLRKDYDRAALHPDNLDYEAREPARVLPDQLGEIAGPVFAREYEIWGGAVRGHGAGPSSCSGFRLPAEILRKSGGRPDA